MIDYVLPIYYNNLRQTEIRRLSQLQYRAGKVVTGAYHLTSQVKLEAELGWETIGKRADMLGLSIFQKIHMNMSRPLIKTCMPQLTITTYNLRSEGKYPHPKYTNAKHYNSFFPYYTRLWNSLDRNIRIISDMDTFKDSIKLIYKPIKHKHYHLGSKYGNMLNTRLRVGRSLLNAHSFPIGLSESPACDCGSSQESTQHVLLSCPLYSSERQLMLDQVTTLVPGFLQKSLKQQTDILLFGLSPDTTNFFIKNPSLTNSVQAFLIRLIRFES